MHTIKNTSLPLILLLLLCIHPLQAAQNLLIESKYLPIDAAPASDYQAIAEEGVDKFEEYLLMLQKKCIATEKIKKGLVLLVGTTGSGKSTLICDLLGASFVKILDDYYSEDSDASDDEAMVDIDPNHPPNFPVPKIGNNACESQTFLPGVFANPNVKNGLHYCDTSSFYDTRGYDEANIAAIAPALVLHSAQRIQAVLAVISYDNIISCKGRYFLVVIRDVMTYFKHAPWDSIKKATFVCITKCAHIKNSTAVKAIKDQVRGVDRALEKKLDKYNKAIKALEDYFSQVNNLDKQKKEEYENTVADYEALGEQAKFFSIFAAIDPITKKIILDKNKLLFSRPFHKNRQVYRTKIIEALKNSPGLERKHLSECDYANPTLTHQLAKIVHRMNGFFSARASLKKKNEDLQKSISNKQGISQQINNLQKQITDKYLESTKKSTDKSLVAIYNPPPYDRTFSQKEKIKNWRFGALGGALGAGIGFGIAAAAVEAGLAYNALGAAGGGPVGAAIANPYHNIKPYQRFVYSASVPVYQMSVCYGAGTFKSISPDGWQVNEASDNPKNQFTYQPTHVAVKHPVCYEFEYMGYFHTDGHCQVTLYSRYNELETTKQRVQILAQEMKDMLAAIQALNREKKSKIETIARNKKEIERLDGCIRNTYEKREKDQCIAYTRSKCAMLAFFASKPLFNKAASVQMNDDNDEKEKEKDEGKKTDDPLLVNMKRCIKQWETWLRLNGCPPAQADKIITVQIVRKLRKEEKKTSIQISWGAKLADLKKKIKSINAIGFNPEMDTLRVNGLLLEDEDEKPLSSLGFSKRSTVYVERDTLSDHHAHIIQNPLVVIIAIATYDCKKIDNLPSVKKEVKNLRELFHNTCRYKVVEPKKEVSTLTSNEMMNFIGEQRNYLRKSGDDHDALIFFYSGHGANHSGKDLVLCSDAMVSKAQDILVEGYEDFLKIKDKFCSIENFYEKPKIFFHLGCRSTYEKIQSSSLGKVKILNDLKKEDNTLIFYAARTGHKIDAIATRNIVITFCKKLKLFLNKTDQQYSLLYILEEIKKEARKNNSLADYSGHLSTVRVFFRKGKHFQANADEQKYNNHQSVDNEVFDID